jgi:hypothetical protein
MAAGGGGDEAAEARAQACLASGGGMAGLLVWAICGKLMA